MPCVILLHSIMIIMWVAFFMLMYCWCAVHLDLSINIFPKCTTYPLLHLFQILAFMSSDIIPASINVHLFPDNLTQCPYTSRCNLIPFGVVLVGFKNGPSLNLIQTLVYFSISKMPKAIYSNSAYLQELILILILASTFSMLSVLFCIFFLSEGIQKKGSSSSAQQRAGPAARSPANPQPSKAQPVPSPLGRPPGPPNL